MSRKLLLSSCVLFWAFPAWADDLASVREKAAVCDPNAPMNCLRPAANGSLTVNGGGGGGASSVQYNATQPTIASGASTTPQSDNKGNTYVAPATGAVFPTTIGGTPSINNAQVNGATVATGPGASNSGTQRVVVATDSTFAITNTSFASTQSGTWTVAQGAPGASAWKVDGSAVTQPISLPTGAVTTTGALQPPTAGTGKITLTTTALTASTSTTISAANANVIAQQISCGSGGVAISETGATLTAGTFGTTGSTVYISVNNATNPYITPIATQTAVTAYSATAQTCTVTDYLR